jgi:LuxR family transcriptional regulator, maltose regulon positive regulatory protein
LRGEPAAAERAFASMSSSIDRWRAAGRRTLTAWGYYYLGQVQRAQGHLGAALAIYQEALAATTEPGRPAMPAAGVAHVGLAEVAYERDELAAAMDHATQGVELSRQGRWTLPLVTGLTMLARIRHAQGDRFGALDAIRQAEQVQQSGAVVSLLNPLPAVRAELALATGQVETAAGWIKQRGLAEQDPPSYPQERKYLVLARLLLAQQAPDQALALLERWTALAAAQARTDSSIKLGVLQALAHSACGDRNDALAVLAQTLDLAAPEGYLRVFVDQGPPMAALLRELLLGRRHPRQAAADVPHDYHARLTQAFEQAGMPIRRSARRGGVLVAGLVEPLTERELEVLKLLAAGAPNRAIAEQLVVTPETVKKHLSHLYDKLSADNRTQAVTRAGELGLLL